jgi:hypothetical protein
MPYGDCKYPRGSSLAVAGAPAAPEMTEGESVAGERGRRARGRSAAGECGTTALSRGIRKRQKAAACGELNSGSRGPRIPKPVSFRAPAEFRNADRRQERNPEDPDLPMSLQGIPSMLSPFNFISLPQFCARSSQRGLVFSMRSIFFFRRHDLICFSRLIMTVTWLDPA